MDIWPNENKKANQSDTEKIICVLERSKDTITTSTNQTFTTSTTVTAPPYWKE